MKIKLQHRCTVSLLALLVSFAFACKVQAVCRWTDRDGVLHLTDDRSKVPKGARCDEDIPQASVQQEEDHPAKESLSDYAEYRVLLEEEGVKYSYDVRHLQGITTTNRRGRARYKTSIPVRAEKIGSHEIKEGKVILDCMKRPGVWSPPGSLSLPYSVAERLHYNLCIAVELPK